MHRRFLAKLTKKVAMETDSRQAGANRAQLSVIIPTLASAERAASLQRAIWSIRASSATPVSIIVVVNGNRFDAGLCHWLAQQKDVQHEYIGDASAPGAVLRGRELVKTDFFSTLDDDDEYLPGSSDWKMSLLQADAQAHMIVANAYLCSDGTDSMCYDRLADVPGNPLKCLMQFNWLTSGNALYRTAAVGASYFQNYHPYVEWTWLAFRLAMDGKRIAVMDRPACRHHDTLQSLSKSERYLQSYLPLFRRMLERAPPPAIARMIERKIGAASHGAAFAALREGRRLDAWRHHWHSLGQLGGLRYLAATRHLFK
jgi:hypothetical protein